MPDLAPGDTLPASTASTAPTPPPSTPPAPADERPRDEMIVKRDRLVVLAKTIAQDLRDSRMDPATHIEFFDTFADLFGRF